MLFFISLLLLTFHQSTCLDNGLALTPPMGWLSWARFFCEVDCVHHPLSCINEQLYLDMADAMINDGYQQVGYEYVNIDDCWMSMQRDSAGKLTANSTRFPHGIKYMSDYMHSRKLKLGIYEDYGTKTCGGYPGILGHLETDADSFASWDVDSLKLDGCYAEASTMNKGYPEMGHYMNKTGHPMIYSCSWPDYIRAELGDNKPNYTLVAANCNLWRNYNDIFSEWKSILGIIDYYDSHWAVLAPHHGPGHWNDPDMIVIGNDGITEDMAKVQMTIWSIYSAPLLMSNDLRYIAPSFKEILQNRAVIAVDQDPLGKLGKQIFNVSAIGFYLKPMTPVRNGQYSYAIAAMNRGHMPMVVRIPALSHINLTNPSGYEITDLWTGANMGTVMPDGGLRMKVNATGAVMFKATVQAGVNKKLLPITTSRIVGNVDESIETIFTKEILHDFGKILMLP